MKETSDLESFPLPSSFSHLQEQGITCRVRVADKFFAGEVYFEEGVITSAVFGHLAGDAAVAAILITEEPEYTVESAATGLSSVELAQPPQPAPIVGPPLDETPADTTSGVLEQPADDLPLNRTLMGIGNPPSEEMADTHLPRHEILPEPLRSDSQHDELESWAARAAEEEAIPQAARPTDRPSLTLREQPPSSLGQSLLTSHSFGEERSFPTIWAVVGLSALLMLGMMFWGAQTEHVVAKKPVAPSVAPVLPPSLAKGSPPTAPAGALAPTVLVRAQIGQDGKIKQATALAPRPGLGALEKQAAESVRSYIFRPATQGGAPLDYWVTIPVRFNPADGVRQLSVKGSDTIGATLGPSWARGTESQQPGLKIVVEALGSSTGFVGLLDGTADVAASSRAIRAEELALAGRLGVQLREVVVAYDGIAVIVHPNNPLRALDVESVARIFAQRMTRWSELAGSDNPIHPFGRPSYSGTHSFLRERMLAVLGPGGAFGASVENLEHSKDIVARVASDIHAIGYVSIGHLQPSVRALALSARTADTPVAPSSDTIRDGSYPIARPLYLYLRADSGHDARLFVDHALSIEGQAAVARDGFVTLDSPIASELALEIPAPHVPPPELRRIYFDRGSATIEPGSSADLAAAAAGVSSGKHALVIGHADSAGTLETNEVLARQRAQAVANQLKPQANRSAVIEVEVAAASHPLATNSTADGRAANRRVDVILHSARTTPESSELRQSQATNAPPRR